MTIAKQQFEDVSPIKNGDFRDRHVSFLQGMYPFPFGGIFLYEANFFLVEKVVSTWHFSPRIPGWSDSPWKILRTEVGKGVTPTCPTVGGLILRGFWWVFPRVSCNPNVFFFFVVVVVVVSGKVYICLTKWACSWWVLVG